MSERTETLFRPNLSPCTNLGTHVPMKLEIVVVPFSSVDLESNEDEEGFAGFRLRLYPAAFPPTSPALNPGVPIHTPSNPPTPSRNKPGPSTPDSTPMVAGIVSGVAGAALIAVAVLGKRRRDTKQRAIQQQQLYPAVQQYPAAQQYPVLPPPADDDDDDDDDDDNLEKGAGHAVQLPSYAAALASGGGGGGGDKSSPPPYIPEADGGEAVFRPPPQPTGALAGGAAQPGTDHSCESTAAKDGDAAGLLLLAGGGTTTAAADGSSAGRSTTTDTTSTATNSTANVSTVERAELAEFHRQQVGAAADGRVAGEARPEQAPGAAGGGVGPSSAEAVDRPNSSGDIGLGQAVLAAAQELARSCQVPGISEAAGVLCIMANLFTDSRENDKASESRLRQCRSIVLALKRAEKVVGKVSFLEGRTCRLCRKRLDHT